MSSRGAHQGIRFQVEVSEGEQKQKAHRKLREGLAWFFLSGRCEGGEMVRGKCREPEGI